MTKALLVIDPQYDFCEGGALGVDGATAILPLINKLSEDHDIVIMSQDWHGPNNISFASVHGVQPFQMRDVYYHGGVEHTPQMMWPDHCVMGTHGAEFHEDVQPTVDRAIAVIRKGYRDGVDSYSAFFENDKVTPTGLHGMLQELGVTEVVLCGIALDYCVRYSAEDAKRLGYGVTVLVDACAGIDENSVKEAMDSFDDLGIVVG